MSSRHYKRRLLPVRVHRQFDRPVRPSVLPRVQHRLRRKHPHSGSYSGPSFLPFCLWLVSSRVKMKVVGPTCALRGNAAGEDVVLRLSEQSLSISKCKVPLLDEHMSAFLQDMNSCYSKLKELVPTLPANKKASRVEILQHVIDYIWDLQVELDSPRAGHQGAAGTRTLNAELGGISVENGCSEDRILCR